MAFPPDLIDAVQNADRITAFTGAGISAESGIPTFREAQTGLWSRYDPQELATPQAFRRNPELVWRWYAWRRNLVRQAEPNAGHRALAQLEGRAPNFHLITQNVDGLHQRAGSRQVIELHGNLTRVRCPEERRLVQAWPEGETDLGPPPCPHCGAPLRPDVVWFGESLPGDALERAFEVSERCDLFFSIGTSTLIQPAASLPFHARRAGAIVVEVNPDQTPLSHQADFRLAGPSGELLPDLLRQVWPGPEN